MSLTIGEPRGSKFFLLFTLIFVLATTKPCLGAENATSGCFERERQALLAFKRSLEDPSLRLASWDGENCCQWLGVACDNTTGHVTRLDLSRNNSDSVGILESNELNSSLAELTRLSYMDLSWNNFGGTLPEFIGSMTQLRFLNLSSTGLRGIVPHRIGNLSKLSVLDLGTEQDNSLVVDDVTWVSRLLSLRYLDLSGVSFLGARNLDKVLLYMIPSLLELRLSSCGLSNSNFSDTHLDPNTTLSNIETLDLSHNMLEHKFPLFLQNMTAIRDLDLSYNQLNSSIPIMNNVVKLNLAGNRFRRIQDTGIWNLCRVKHLDLWGNYMEGEFIGPSSECDDFSLETLILGYNHFNSTIPTSLERLTALRELHLDWNKLTGFIPESLGNLISLKNLDLSGNTLTGSIPKSLGNLTSLRKLDLSSNLLTGAIPDTLGELSDLEILYLSWNMLTSIPFSIGNLSKLKFLDLSSNLLHGALPETLGKLSELRFISISNNSLEGVVTEAHFVNTSMLKHLDATSNHKLSFRIRPDWEPPFQISHILLGSCRIELGFPQWFRTQKNLVIVIMSNCGISGPLPQWFRDLPVIEILDLSHNHLSGPLTNLPSNRTIKAFRNFPFVERFEDFASLSKLLLLKNNIFNGSIPESLCQITDLVNLDLSRNMLSGDVPHCFENLHELDVLILSSNRLSGVIPSSLGNLGDALQWLHMNNNSFYGEIPASLSNLTGLKVLDLGDNSFVGNIPKWIGEKIEFLVVLRLHKNNFSGSIPKELCESSELQILDLGDNSLSGRVPRCFEKLQGMVKGDSNLYFSGGFEQSVFQVMKGVSLEYTTTMRYVVNMDLSSNNLVGEIPEELTLLSGLIGLNLSHNHLTGRVPDKIGNLTSLMSLDLSLNNLSGMIPQSISAMTFLSHLNLSHNNLSGRIPTGSQLQTFIDPSIYAGNSELCGSPLPKKCTRDEVSTNGSKNEEYKDKDDDSDKVWLYVSVSSGFTTGFLGILGVLLFKKKWRLYFFK